MLLASLHRGPYIDKYFIVVMIVDFIGLFFNPRHSVAGSILLLLTG
jgi:hypothetical protein